MDIPQGYKQTELGIIPDDWEVKRISDFTSIITGGTPSYSTTGVLGWKYYVDEFWRTK